MGSKIERIILGIVTATVGGILVFHYQKWAAEEDKQEIINISTSTTETIQSDPAPNTIPATPIVKKEKKTTFLKVNNRSELTVSFDSSKEVEIFHISTDGEEYNITYLPSWCSVKKLSESFVLTCESNTNTSVREDWFKVNSGNESVKITIKQKGVTPPIQETPVIIKSSETTYLEVEGKTSLTTSFTPSGGRKTFTISTDGEEYDITYLPTWCSVKKSSESFTLTCESNSDTSARDDWFKVTSGNKSVRITVKQKGAEAKAKPTKTTICYQGDAYACILSINITIAGQTYTPYGNSFTIEGIPKGRQRYSIVGTINCPYIGGCTASGSGYITIGENSTFYVVWQNTAYAQCSISLSE